MYAVLLLLLLILFFSIGVFFGNAWAYKKLELQSKDIVFPELGHDYNVEMPKNTTFLPVPQRALRDFIRTRSAHENAQEYYDRLGEEVHTTLEALDTLTDAVHQVIAAKDCIIWKSSR